MRRTGASERGVDRLVGAQQEAVQILRRGTSDRLRRLRGGSKCEQAETDGGK